jgi:hypothetical protein
MDGSSAVSGVGDSQSDLSAVYQAAIAKRAQDAARTQGANAVRLVEGTTGPDAESRPLPDGATISVRA